MYMFPGDKGSEMTGRPAYLYVSLPFTNTNINKSVLFKCTDFVLCVKHAIAMAKLNFFEFTHAKYPLDLFVYGNWNTF